MSTTIVIIAVVVVMALLLVGVFLLISARPNEQGQIRSLMRTNDEGVHDAPHMLPKHGRADDEIIEEIKRAAGSAEAQKDKEDQERKLFRAGIYNSQGRMRFRVFSQLCLVGAPLLFFLVTIVWQGNWKMAIMAGFIGLLIGYSLPQSYLEKAIRRRQEDLMYYLPLVIEQVSIGVSSALDVGPCITMIVHMANDRDSHNPVTEMFMHVEKLMRSGLNLEDALEEVGQVSGMSEVKHAFMFLAQCAKHGGEVSRQLQELADAVMVQKQVSIEGRIAQLPVKATGPLGMVFMGFFMMLFAGLFTRLKSAFESF